MVTVTVVDFGLTSDYFFPDSDSSDSDTYSYSDSVCDSYIGRLWFNLWLGFVMAQNDQTG